MELSKEVLILISNEIKDLICILNENLIIKYLNEKICLKQLGYSNEDLIDKKISNIIIGEDFTKIEELIKEKTQENDKFVDIQMFHKDGSKIWFEVKVQPIEDKTRMKEFLLISRDISEKKFNELIVKDSKEKYQSIIENIKEGYYEVDLKGNFTYVNDALCKFLGYSNRELLIKNFDITTDKQTKNIVYKTFNKVFRTEIRQNIFQFPVFRKNGEQAFFETSVYLKYNPKGKKSGFYGIVRDITERKKEEDLEEKFKIELTQKVRLRTKELEESQEKYRNLFQHSNDGIFLHDLNGNIIEANQKVMEYFGYTKEEILSLNISQLHPTSELVESKKAFEEITKKGFVVFEINFKKKNGETFPAEVSSSLFTIGEETFIQGEVRDITFRKQAERNLIDSEEKYRNMINNLDLGFYQVNWEGNLLNYNPAFSYLLGFDPTEDLLKINIKQFWQNPSERDIYLKKLEEEKLVKNYIVHSRKRDGQNIVLNLNSHLINNQPVMIQGVVSDITEKFELEQKVKESESRYRNLFESVPFAIALIDQKGKIIYCNPAVEPLLGYSIEELIGKEFRNLMAIQPDYLPMMLERFQRLLKGEILPPFDAQLYKKKGDLVWINYQTSIVKIDDNILVQAILHDISERKRADLLVQEEIQKLKELDQIRKDLISRVSHELKTPLVSVCGASELLLELFDDKMTKESLELIKMIEKGGSRLKYLVDNLLDITRIEYNKFELMPELTNLSAIIKDCSSELMYLIKQRKLNIKLEFPEEIIINIDRIRIEHVILNLLSNAIKNTPPNGNISIKLYQKKNWIEISITDTGIGLTEEEMGIIFTRFGKIERYEEGIEFIDIQGSGLGLFISKEIVDLHGGTIRAESEGRGKGSTFIVKLPTS
ncbi:MAG: PAS domain S-box protein [Candidatus Lokiarchaeota archaeon]|nr:PAS domain S-box protein [Candidatus Lokiarchaeota archaeon]